MIEQLTSDDVSRRGTRNGVEAMLASAARRMLDFTPVGAVVVELPSGQRYRFGGETGEPAPMLKLKNFSVLRRAIARGRLGFAESYISGDLDISDPTALFRFYLDNERAFSRSGGNVFKGRLIDRLAHLARRNSVRGSRRNIAAHYDLSNDFFRLWLDPDMIYSSGLFSAHAESLEQSQDAKIRRILELLELSDGERVLEIGCGWGALARAAAQSHGAHVRGITLSQAQLSHCRETVQADCAPGSSEFHLQDYRESAGEFDRIMSVEMIEAVGEDYWPTYFQTLHDRLAPGGCAVIQAITMDDMHFPAYRQGTDFIQRYIFPGGMLPTRTIIARQAEAAGLRLDHCENFGASYAETLRHWRRRFEAAWPQIERLGFDETFRRMWRYYLTYCEAGFDQGIIDVGLYRLRKP